MWSSEVYIENKLFRVMGINTLRWNLCITECYKNNMCFKHNKYNCPVWELKFSKDKAGNSTIHLFTFHDYGSVINIKLYCRKICFFSNLCGSNKKINNKCDIHILIFFKLSFSSKLGTP